MINLINEKIIEPSQKEYIAITVQEILEKLNENKINYVVIGSCSIFVHTGIVSRIPGDLDIVILKKNLKKTINSLECIGAKVIERFGFYQAVLNEFTIHIVVDSLKLIVPKHKAIAGEFALQSQIRNRIPATIRFRAFNIDCKTFVPSMECCLVLLLITPITDESIISCINILAKHDIDIVELKNVLSVNKCVLPILDSRIINVEKLLIEFAQDIPDIKQKIFSTQSRLKKIKYWVKEYLIKE